MQLNPSEISELLKQRIEGMGLNTNLRTEGTVVRYRRYLPCSRSF